MIDVDAHGREPNMLRTSVLALLGRLSFIFIQEASLSEFEHIWDLVSHVVIS